MLGWMLKGLFYLWVGIFCMILGILPLVGVVTGHLYLPLGRHGGDFIDGPWAIVLSVVLLSCGIGLLFEKRLRRMIKPRPEGY